MELIFHPDSYSYRPVIWVEPMRRLGEVIPSSKLRGLRNEAHEVETTDNDKCPLTERH